MGSEQNASFDQEAVIEGCKRQDRSAQEKLYRHFADEMFGVCLGYTKDRSTAKDILQDGFIKVFRNISKYEGKGSLEGWIRRIIINTAIDHCRKVQRHRVVELEDYHGEPVDSKVLDNISAQELLELVRQLPDKARAAFNLYMVEGYSHNEVAEKLGVSVGTSKSQVSRARQLLQGWIHQRDDNDNPKIERIS